MACSMCGGQFAVLKIERNSAVPAGTHKSATAVKLGSRKLISHTAIIKTTSVDKHRA